MFSKCQLRLASTSPSCACTWLCKAASARPGYAHPATDEVAMLPQQQQQQVGPGRRTLVCALKPDFRGWRCAAPAPVRECVQQVETGARAAVAFLISLRLQLPVLRCRQMGGGRLPRPCKRSGCLSHTQSFWLQENDGQCVAKLQTRLQAQTMHGNGWLSKRGLQTVVDRGRCVHLSIWQSGKARAGSRTRVKRRRRQSTGSAHSANS